MSKLRAHYLWPIIMLASLIAFCGVVFADAPTDPTTNPTGALQQFWNAVVAKKWGVAAVVGTMLLVALVRFVAPRAHGKFGAFILQTRVSAVLAFLSGGLMAVATQLMKGGALSMNLIAYGFGFGVAAIGGYNAFWDLLFPADKKAAPKMEIPATPPPPVRPGVFLPFAFIAFALTLSSCNVCTSAATSPTCARKALTGIDALDGAAARISRRWLQKCGDDARALKDAGKLAEADAAYTRCESIGGKLATVTKTTEDGANAASDAVDVGEAAGQKDYGSILAPVFKFVDDLQKAFADAGVTLPNISLLGVK